MLDSKKQEKNLRRNKIKGSWKKWGTKTHGVVSATVIYPVSSKRPPTGFPGQTASFASRVYPGSGQPPLSPRCVPSLGHLSRGACRSVAAAASGALCARYSHCPGRLCLPASCSAGARVLLLGLSGTRLLITATRSATDCWRVPDGAISVHVVAFERRLKKGLAYFLVKKLVCSRHSSPI